MQRFYISPDVPEDIIRVFLISDLLAECLKANKKPAKKITHFTTKFRLKNLTYFTWHWKQYVTATQLKKVLTLHIFQQRCFCLGSEKIFAVHHFVMPVCIFLYIYLRKFLFQEHSKVLSGRGWDGGSLNKFLKVAHCFPCKMFYHFSFNRNFRKFNYFLAFWYFYIYSIKTLKFARQYRLQG